MRPQQLQVGQHVARSLQEQHRDLDVEQVPGALVRRPSRRMQREPEEGQAADARQRRSRLGLRSHAAAERLAAGNERQRRQKPGGCGNRGADRGLGDVRRIGPPGPLFHVRELIAQGGDAALREPLRHALQERMRHAGSRAVRQHETRPGIGRRQQQARNPGRRIDGYGDLLRFSHSCALAVRCYAAVHLSQV